MRDGTGAAPVPNEDRLRRAINAMDEASDGLRLPSEVRARVVVSFYKRL